MRQEPTKTDGFAIRRVVPADAAALRTFYGELSPDSRRARFLGCVGGLSSEQALSFCTPDHMHAEGFVAVASNAQVERRVVGHLCLEPAGPHSLELAVAVADSAQGRGIGRALFKAALEWAASRGYRMVIASCLADNSRVLSLLSSAPGPARISAADAGLVNVYVSLRGPLPAAWSAPAPAARRPHRSPPEIGRCRIVWRAGQRPATDVVP